jgi:hypothetical protein
MDALPGLLSSLLAVTLAAAPDESAFAKQFAALQKLGDAGKWSDEKKGLLKLLNQTGDQPFVQARRTEIVEELRRAAIRTAVPQPDPATMTDGKLLAWDRHGGDLSISYGPGQWGDFTHEDDFWCHPAVFDGPVTFRFDGDSFTFGDNDLLNVVVGYHDDVSVGVVLGARKDLPDNSYVAALCEIAEQQGEHRNVLATAARAPNYGKHFDVEIVVGATEIAVNAGGSRLVQAKLPAKFHGSFAISDKKSIKHLSLRGHATTSWLQGKLDASTHDAEEKFLEKWKIEDELPPWLRDGATPAGSATAGATSGGAGGDAKEGLPWPVSAEQLTLYESLMADFSKEPPEKLVARLRKLKPGELPQDVADYLLLVALDRNDDLSPEADRLEAFCARNPDFPEGRFLHAELQIEREAFEDAARELVALQGKYDDPGRLAVALAEVDLMLGKPEEAQRVLRDARAAGVKSSEFDELDQTVVHVLRGPNFPRRFEQTSPHFTLATDIDNDTARAALKVLEESYAICSKVFGASDAPARTFPVYYFSGETSYAEYAGEKPKTAHSTAGMYSPLFKHLMVWNLPEREETARTLRHEATHQYLDLLGYRVPVWFNEGLAVYVELIASSSKADVKGGALDRTYLDELDGKKLPLIPLKHFIELGDGDFYEQSDVTYPEAWALVHFLRHGAAPSGASKEDPAPQEVNARLMAALAQRLAPDDVVKKAFEGVDLGRFEKHFLDHVADLRRQADKKN